MSIVLQIRRPPGALMLFARLDGSYRLCDPKECFFFLQQHPCHILHAYRPCSRGFSYVASLLSAYDLNRGGSCAYMPTPKICTSHVSP